MTDKKHLVFDIDMTLVLSTDCEFDRDTQRAVACDDSRPPAASSPRRRPVRSQAFKADYFDLPQFGMRVNLRPFAVNLLHEVMHDPRLTVSIWSAGERPYVQAVAKELARRTGKRFDIVWSREMCEKDFNDEYYKPLEKIAQSPEGQRIGMNGDASNVMLIDDLRLNLEANWGKVYLIKPYDRVNRFDFALNQFAYILFMSLANLDASPQHLAPPVDTY